MKVKKLNPSARAIAAYSKLLKASAQKRVFGDACVHIDEQGFCTLWHSTIGKRSRNQREDVVDGKTVFRDNVKIYPEICASCPSYKGREG